MSVDTLRFGPALKARFMERPNRFLVRCSVRGLGVVEAFLPNPGRLWELLLPGATLHLAELPESPERRARFKVLAAERDRVPVFIDTHLTNTVARYLIERDKIPGLVDAEVVRVEVPVGRSRFDFLLQRGDRKIYLEVKSCTLFGNGVAMFPDKEVRDRGSYILVLRLDENKKIQVGRLGTLSFRPGFYLYVGSAMRNLSARIARHSRFRKKLHWHIDYLRQQAGGFLGLPIRSSKRDECEVARALTEMLTEGPPGFGSSDCTCPTHLFYSAKNPLEQPSFHELLQHFRMRPPGEPID